VAGAGAFNHSYRQNADVVGATNVNVNIFIINTV
jgi:hypothetical protein